MKDGARLTSRFEAKQRAEQDATLEADLKLGMKEHCKLFVEYLQQSLAGYQLVVPNGWQKLSVYPTLRFYRV